MLAPLDNDTGCTAQPLKEPFVLMIRYPGESAGSQVDAGPQPEIGAVHMGVGAIIEQLLPVLEIEGPPQLGDGTIASQSDDAEHNVGAVASQLELITQPGGLDPAISIGACQPQAVWVGLPSDERLDTDRSGCANVASANLVTVDTHPPADVGAVVGACVEHHEDADRERYPAGRRLKGGEAVGEEVLFVMGGYNDADPADPGSHERINPVRAATDR